MSTGMGAALRDPYSMDLEELVIRAEEGHLLLRSIELRLDFLDHYPQVKSLYAEAVRAVRARLKLYEQIIDERERGLTDARSEGNH